MEGVGENRAVIGFYVLVFCQSAYIIVPFLGVCLSFLNIILQISISYTALYSVLKQSPSPAQ